ncbi:pyruvate, phosphate dikinase [Pendulispora albinea]|uniref:Pyruvate, phosphate dikinase n=1 Tax=Pendulispora albinea TaxID=2741071 RepID=A0ABZ2LQU8_9BACT
MTKRVFFFGEGKAEGDSKRRDLLGGKGAGLAEMTALGLPVPPGFTLSTEVCTEFFATPNKPDLPSGVDAEIAEALAKVEAVTGAKFGDPENPLLVSVRSGARASMPGMMDTILNLGLNDACAEGLAKKTGDARFAYDAYRRFIAMYSDVALELEREPFNAALDKLRVKTAQAKGLDITRINAEELKKKVPDSELSADDLKALVAEFLSIVKKTSGKDFPSDPHEQLRGAIRAVFRSWNTHRAVVYRRMHDIPDSWGTACNVQAMVFGNLGDTSATGVAFTRNPSTGEKKIFGEWLPKAQGEDVVAGIRTPLPIDGSPESLEAKMPDAYQALLRISEKLESHFRDMQDLEFTIQSGKLYMLQCRSGKRTSRAAVRIAVEQAKEKLISQEEAILRVDASSLDQLLHPTLDPKAPKKFLARGLAASPGAAVGHIVFSADEAEKRAAQGKPVILVRVETSPEDIHGMKAARGIITSRGGMTSHAAVIARGMGKACIAGCSAASISYAEQTLTVTVYDAEGRQSETVVLKKGDVVTIDGSTGTIYAGEVPTIPAALAGEFGELMAWADKVRTMKVRANADTPLDARTARSFGAEGIGLCRTEHMFFEEDRISAMREMILSDDVQQRERALAKLLPFQREDFVGIFQEMRGLKVTIRLLDPPLHEFLPNDPKQLQQLSRTMGVSVEKLETRTKDLHEFNPMLGHRGCRLAITYPEIYAMQVRAILEAALHVASQGTEVYPEIMIPLAITAGELLRMRAIVDKVAGEVFANAKPVPFSFGTMVELPRAAIVADQLANVAEFFSFGTNDLTQSAMGLSRDDAGKFLPAYVETGLLPKDPFVSIDTEGVGALVQIAVERGRKTRPNIKLGICGEHGGDPASCEFFQSVGLDYVSCSPFRVPIARLAVSQAALRARKAK